MTQVYTILICSSIFSISAFEFRFYWELFCGNIKSNFLKVKLGKWMAPAPSLVVGSLETGDVSAWGQEGPYKLTFTYYFFYRLQIGFDRFLDKKQILDNHFTTPTFYHAH